MIRPYICVGLHWITSNPSRCASCSYLGCCSKRHSALLSLPKMQPVSCRICRSRLRPSFEKSTNHLRWIDLEATSAHLATRPFANTGKSFLFLSCLQPLNSSTRDLAPRLANSVLCIAPSRLAGGRGEPGGVDLAWPPRRSQTAVRQDTLTDGCHLPRLTGNSCPKRRERTTSGQYNVCGHLGPSTQLSRPPRTTSTTMLPCI